MKIRKSFVSNSSSCSFVACSSYRSTWHIAMEMVTQRGFKDDEKLRKLFEKYEKIMNWKTPVCFTSINFDTWIWFDEKYFVSTCNNITWDIVEDYFYRDEIYPAEEMLFFNPYFNCMFRLDWSVLPYKLLK